MEVRERTVIIKEFVSKDGKVFSNEEDCKSHEISFDGWYEYNNFVVDPEKLKEWKPENWEHFKWEFFRNYVGQHEDTYNMNFRLHKIEMRDFVPIDSADKLLKIIKKVTYEFRERSSQRYLTIPWHRSDREFDSKSFMKLIVGSGLIKAKTFSNKVFRHLMWRNDLDAAKYLIEQGYKLKEENIVYAIDNFLRFDERPKFRGEIRGEAVIRFGDETELVKDDETDIYHFRYFSYKPQKEFIDLLLKEFDGDYDKLVIDIINNDRLGEDCYGKLDVLHKSAKEKGIDSAFTRMDIKDFIRFALVWSSSNISLYKVEDEYFISKNHWSIEKGNGVKLEKWPEPELFDKMLFKIPSSQDRHNKNPIELAEYILENIAVNKRKFYFWILRHQIRGRNWEDKKVSEEMQASIDELKNEIFSRADYMNVGGGTVKGGAIGSEFEMRESMSKDIFYKTYPGLEFFNDRFEVQKIIDVKRRKVNKDKPIVEKGESVRIDRNHSYRNDKKVDYEYFFND